MMTVQRDPQSEQLLPNIDAMPFDQQGSANACGTTSLAMVMSYLGVPETKESIDAVIRQMNIFSSPEDLISFARNRGLQAEGYNNGVWETIEAPVPLGQPSILLINANYTYPDGNSISGFHYVVFVGHGIDPTNQRRYAVLHDPNFGGPMCLYEADLSVMGNKVGWGFHDYYLTFGSFASPTLPPGNNTGIQGTLGALEGVTNITNGLSSVIHPKSTGGLVHGIGQIVAGIAGGIISALGGLLQVAGQWLTGAVNGIPVLRNIVQPIGDLLNGIGAVIGDIGNGVGNAINDLAKGLGAVVNDITNGFGRALGALRGAFGSLIKGDFGGFFSGIGNAIGGILSAVGNAIGDAVSAVGNAIGDAVSAVGNAISDAASAVGNAVSDFFSGW